MEEFMFQASFVVERWYDSPVLSPSYGVIKVPERKFSFVWRPAVRSLKDEEPDDNYVITIYAIRSPPEKAVDVLKNRLIPGLSRDLVTFKSSEDGMADFPAEYRTFAYDLNRELCSLAKIAITALLWRAGVLGGPVDFKIDVGSIRYQHRDEPLDQENPWLAHQLPTGVKLVGSPWLTSRSSTIDDEVEESVERMLANAVHQPLYHDLLREAFSNRSYNARSSLVVCVAAIETGVKTLVADLQPDTSWLLENLPSPPVVKLLRELIPNLPVRGSFNGEARRLNKKTITAVKDAVEKRNHLVHGREVEFPPNYLDSLLQTTSELLYLFDFYRGDLWAREYFDDSLVGFSDKTSA